MLISHVCTFYGVCMVVNYFSLKGVVDDKYVTSLLVCVYVLIYKLVLSFYVHFLLYKDTHSQCHMISSTVMVTSTSGTQTEQIV